MKKDATVYIDDMVDAMAAIERYVAGMDETKFSQTDYIQDAVIRQLAIIGEAARNVPEDIRKIAPLIPWRKIVDFRNVIIHEYSGVSLGRVWQIIVKELSDLKSQLTALKNDMPPAH